MRAYTDSNNYATVNRGYRMVAVFDSSSSYYGKDVYAANYRSDGVWEFRYGDDVSRYNRATFYLLCKSCDGGSRFNSNTTLDGRRIMDSETFWLDTSGRVSDNNSNDDQDLALKNLRYSYFSRGNDVEVTLETTIENEGRYETRLDELTYEIEVDGDRLSTRDYDIQHVRTDCDDNSVRSYDDEDIDIDAGDECEITVEITMDRDEVEDEWVDIVVEIESREDDYSANDDEEIRFRVN